MRTLHRYVMRTLAEAAVGEHITGVKRDKSFLRIQVENYLTEHIHVRSTHIFDGNYED